MNVPKVENLAQVLSCKLMFVHDWTYRNIFLISIADWTRIAIEH